MQGLIICLWESLSFIEAEASSFWRDMTSLVALEVVISTAFGVPGVVGFDDVSILVFSDFGTNLVRLTPTNGDPHGRDMELL